MYGNYPLACHVLWEARTWRQRAVRGDVSAAGNEWPLRFEGLGIEVSLNPNPTHP